MTSSRVFIAGVTPPAFARSEARRAAHRKHKASKLTGPQLSAVLRLAEMKNLVRQRMRPRSPLGPESSWIECIANALRVRHGSVTADMVREVAHRWRMPEFSPGLIDDAVEYIAKAAWGRYELFPPVLAGHKLQLLAAERDSLNITRMVAIDETAAERRRRKDRDRKAEQRAAQAALAPPKRITKKAMAAALKISRPTLYAWIASGKVDAETGEVVELTLPVRGSQLLRSEKRNESVKSPGDPE